MHDGPAFGRYRRSLGPEAGAFFREQGFLIIEGALSAAEVDALNAEAIAICRGLRGSVQGIDEWPASDEPDEDVLRRFLCIHFPHKLSESMLKQLSHPSIVEACQICIGPNVKCMQSMLFIKAAGKPGQAWHQDEDYIPTRDRSLFGAWLALDDATEENGCLWVIPGSHKPGILWPQRDHEDRRFDCAQESVNFPYSDADAISVQVRAGDLVCFNGYLLHRSLPNVATHGYRRALVNHYMSAESLLPWFGDKVPGHVAIADHRDIVMVTGSDPYKYKGVVDLNRPGLRVTGEGGCGKSGADEVP